ncbi:MAG: serine/threonine-protein kinase [Acidobacteriota bacterium]
MESYQLRHFRQVLGRRYEFQAFLGRGAFASVYLVLNLKLKRREALKILSDTFEPDSTARFVAEATMVASLDHPNIVQVYDYGEVEGVVWYSMQYVEGPMLRDEMWARKRFDPVSAVRVAIPLLGALEASHRRGIVHRDIKPSNIILNREGRPYLMDFGIAKASDAHLKTMTGSVLGTPAFMAPEQAEGKPLDGRADLYSFGLVLYQMLAGRSPFETQEPVQLLLLRLREDPPRLATFAPDIDPDLEAILMKTLARDRESRFASAKELERHLVAFLGDEREMPPLALVAPVFELLPLEPESEIAAGNPLADRPASRGATVAFEAAASAERTMAGGPAPHRLRGWARSELAGAALVLAVLLGAGWVFRTQSEKQPARVVVSAPAATSARAPVPSQILPRATEPKPAEAQAATKAPAAQVLLRSAEGSQRGLTSPPPVAAVLEAPRRAVRGPLLIERTEPLISGDAVALCAGTSVIVSVQVGDDGRPTKARALDKSPAACRASAEAAALNFRFDPAQDAEGKPVTGKSAVSISFGEIQ